MQLTRSFVKKYDLAWQSHGFFTADFSAQFNFRMTKLFEVSIGGGYRLFAGIEANNLKNKDFRSPFGELRFTFKE